MSDTRTPAQIADAEAQDLHARVCSDCSLQKRNNLLIDRALLAARWAQAERMIGLCRDVSFQAELTERDRLRREWEASK